MANKEKIIPTRRFDACPTTETLSGIPIKARYGPEDIKDIDYEKDIGNPGEYPFTRGIWGDMYRGKLWTRRVFTGLGTGRDTNERYRQLIKHGETGLYWFGDVPSFHGIDPDHPMAAGNAGVTGVSYCCLRDVYELFDGISLEDVSVSNNCPSMAAAPTYAAFAAYAEDQGYDLKKISGSVLNEPIHGVSSLYPTNCEPLDLSVKLATDVIEHSIKTTPRFHPLAPNAYDLAEFGANPVQEIAITIAITREYIDRMLARGYNIDEFVSRTNIFGCSTDIHLFEEIAKYRAARKVWARLIKERYGAKKPGSYRLYLSSHTLGSSLTKEQPVNNIVRVTVETLGCILGGLQSIDPSGYGEGYFVLTEEEGLTNLNLQNILAYETGVAATADPLAGSYYVESLTSKMKEEMWKIIDKIEEMGGAVKATESGWIRQELEKGVIRKQKDIEEKKRIMVGLNDFVIPPEQEVPIKVGRDRPVEEQVATSKKREEEIKTFKEKRNGVKTKNALEDLWDNAKKGEGCCLIPPIIKALRADATFGEILGVIRNANGYTYDPYEMINYPF